MPDPDQTTEANPETLAMFREIEHRQQDALAQLPPQHQALPGDGGLKQDAGSGGGQLRQGLDLPADGVFRTAELDGETPTLSADDVREVLDRPTATAFRPRPQLGRPILYRVPVPLHRPPLTEPGWIVKVHPAVGDAMPLVDLQVLWSEGQNGSRLIVNVEYDPDDEAVGTWSLPY